MGFPVAFWNGPDTAGDEHHVAMNIIHLRRDDLWLDHNTVLIGDRRFQHIREVLKASVGDTVRIGLLGGGLGEGRIEQIDNKAVRLHVQLNQSPPQRHRFDIVLALPRPKMLRRIFRTVAEFGVANLHLINSARVEKSYWQSPLLRPDKISEALQAGMERSRDTVEPVVHQHALFRPFVEDQLKTLCAGRPCWIAEIGARRALSNAASVPAVVMIGPEGGFVPFEIELARSVIAEPAHLGSRILSVDTALTSVLALGG
jgi:RsmE family RNA methyltransferase